LGAVADRSVGRLRRSRPTFQTRIEYLTAYVGTERDPAEITQTIRREMRALDRFSTSRRWTALWHVLS
jgi:hypothetical protein